MEVFYPKYYGTFSCIAAACPDSCCKEWSVDIDPQAAAFYRQLPGNLGNRLREVLRDTEGGTIIVIENGRCPMWRADGLCRIQAELGHNALCKVCREFPRLTHDYGDFTELGLELSCPEAARIILSGADNNILSRTVAGGEDPEYDRSAMAILKRTRAEFFAFLESTALPFPKILTAFLFYAHSVQEELDGGEKAILSSDVSVSGISAAKDLRPLQDFFLSLEILTPQWKTRLETPAISPRWEVGHKALLHYFILRYWLQAVSDYDIVCRAKFAVAACLLIGGLGGNLIETAQLFSKEIENDLDNIEAILDGAYSHPVLTDVQLLQLLQD